jgi:hypothetical protein
VARPADHDRHLPPEEEAAGQRGLVVAVEEGRLDLDEGERDGVKHGKLHRLLPGVLHHDRDTQRGIVLAGWREPDDVVLALYGVAGSPMYPPHTADIASHLQIVIPIGRKKFGVR